MHLRQQRVEGFPCFASPARILKSKQRGKLLSTLQYHYRRVSCQVSPIYLSTTDPKDQLNVKRAVELAEKAADSWGLEYTDFFTPSLVADVLVNTKKLAGVEVISWGGYPNAERCRLCMGNPDLMETARYNLQEDGGVAAIYVVGRFVFDAANHRDFLGACLGTGIDRSRVGDIMVLGDKGAYILTTPELVQHLEANLTQVRSVSVQSRQIALSELSIPELKVEHIKTFEASLRLDSIAGAGFKISRSKMTDLVKAGDVRVNWKPAKASNTIQSGDVISCSGKGRVEVGEVAATKKGRYVIELVRYV